MPKTTFIDEILKEWDRKFSVLTGYSQGNYDRKEFLVSALTQFGEELVKEMENIKETSPSRLNTYTAQFNNGIADSIKVVKDKLGVK